MDIDGAEAFAKRWVEAWNAHDLDRILEDHADDVVFVSPHAVTIAGVASGEVRGKDALRAYWSKGLQGRPHLHFDVEAVKASVDAVVIDYRDELGRSCAEVLTIRDGRVVRGFGAYARST